MRNKRNFKILNTISIDFSMFLKQSHIQAAPQIAILPDFQELFGLVLVSRFCVRNLPQDDHQICGCTKSFQLPNNKRII